MRTIFKRTISFLVALAFILGALPAILVANAEEDESVTVEASGGYSLSINKTHFEVGEPILVSAVGVSSSDWVGIYRPISKNSIRWDYITTYGAGETFDLRETTQTNNTADEAACHSLPEGTYVIRLVKDDKADVAYTACSIVITVGNPPLVEGDSSLMSIEKSTFTLGEGVTVNATGSGKNWIGIYSVSNYSATYNNNWYYIDGYSGQDRVVPNSTALPVGSYLLAWHEADNSGTVGASAWSLISIVEEAEDDTEDPDVGGGDTGEEGGNTGTEGGNTGNEGDGTDEGGEVETPTDDLYSGSVGDLLGDQSVMSLEKFTFKKGEPIYVTAVGDGNDWIGFYQSLNQFNATKWHWVTTANSGTPVDATQGTTFEAGTYFIKYVKDTNDVSKGTVAVAYIEIIDEEYVAPDEPEEPETPDEPEIVPSISVEKTQFVTGEPIYVTAIGSGKDWVGLFKGGSYLNNAWYYIDTSQNGGVGSGVTTDVTKGNVIAPGTYTLAIVANGSSNLNDAYQTIEIIITDKIMEAPKSATYVLSNSTNGYAKGTLTVTVGEDCIEGVSALAYWATSEGKLSGYSPVRFKTSATTTTYEFTDSAFVPAGATHMVVYLQDDSTLAISEGYVSIELPSGANMRPDGDMVKSFFVISDIHITSSLTDTHANNFKKMLKECIDLNPNGAPIFIVGDIANNGLKEQYENLYTLYNTVLDENSRTASEYPLYIAAGNHDFYPSDYEATKEQFLSYVYMPNGQNPDNVNYDFYLDGIHYVFLGTDAKANNSVSLSDDTIAWLDGVLALDDGKTPTFVLLHQPMYNTVSGSLEGEGWDGVIDEQRLREVLKKYENVMLFNGHTHWEMNSVSNIFEGTDDLPIHAFNCASVAYLWTGYNSLTGENLNGSQGYQVEVYADRVLVKGRDFGKSEWITPAQYSVEFECAPGHEREFSEIRYPNGFDKVGTEVHACIYCSDEKTQGEYAPIITSLGYSVKENAKYGSGICAGYAVNHKAKALFETLNGETLEIGVAMFNTDFIEGDSFFQNGRVSSTKARLQVKMTSDGYSSVSIYLTGITEALYDLDLALCAYVNIIGKDSSIKTGLVQGSSTGVVNTIVKKDGTLHTFSYNSLK